MIIMAAGRDDVIHGEFDGVTYHSVAAAESAMREAERAQIEDPRVFGWYLKTIE